jgi:hypothetical protein
MLWIRYETLRSPVKGWRLPGGEKSTVICEFKDSRSGRVRFDLWEVKTVLVTPLFECDTEQRNAAFRGNCRNGATLRNHVDVFPFHRITPCGVKPGNNGDDLFVLGIKSTGALLRLIIIHKTRDVCGKRLGSQLGGLLALGRGLSEGRVNHAHELEQSEVAVAIGAQDQVCERGAGSLEDVISREKGMQSIGHEANPAHHGRC